MKNIVATKQMCLIACLSLVLSGCQHSPKSQDRSVNVTSSIVGTWKLISGTVIKQGDTTTTDYTQGQEMIKIINNTHFAFLRHDLAGGRDSTEVFVAGGGTYTLNGNIYTEHLEYFNVREWEGNHFEFEFTIAGDTLITRGVEEVKELNVKYYNIEKYCKVIK